MTPLIHDLRPSELSMLISGQHHTVEHACDALSLAAKLLETGGVLALGQARDLGTLLCDDLLAHIVIEQELLVPALRITDAWGTDRADRLLSRLLRRRKELSTFRGALVRKDGVILRGAIDRFIDHRVVAMKRAEQRDLRMLRDDVIGIDCNGG